MKFDPPNQPVPVDAVRSPRIEVFYDGDCPLCRREIDYVRCRPGAETIRFTDLAAPGFAPESYGTTRQRLMAEIHGRLPDGRLITGVEVFRQIYAAIGHTWLVALSRLPLLSHGLDLTYRLFARNRIRLTGRCKTDASACSLTGVGSQPTRTP
jgi:predicted DCC family thiol-disulfide oxidoreductase YuxK